MAPLIMPSTSPTASKTRGSKRCTTAPAWVRWHRRRTGSLRSAWTARHISAAILSVNTVAATATSRACWLRPQTALQVQPMLQTIEGLLDAPALVVKLTKCSGWHLCCAEIGQQLPDDPCSSRRNGEPPDQRRYWRRPCDSPRPPTRHSSTCSRSPVWTGPKMLRV